MTSPWPSREARWQFISEALAEHAQNVRPLPGVVDPRALAALTSQFVASIRREDYTNRLLARRVSAMFADPHQDAFDADKAIIFHAQQGDIDEAVWLAFLATHFGKRADSGWRRLRDVYGMLGTGRWDWRTTSRDSGAFRAWLAANWRRVGGKFGNHRKYETLRPDAVRGTAAVIEQYVRWIGPRRSPSAHFAQVVRDTGNDPHRLFEALYRDMRVISFGRLAKFDYLCLLGRLGLAPIVPGSAFLAGATGPTRGARLLFDGRTNGQSSIVSLQRYIDALAPDLNVGMQVMEDALCNWQKSQMRFVHFTG